MKGCRIVSNTMEITGDNYDGPIWLRTELTSLEKEYNEVRHQLYTKIQMYYRQSIASNYVKESEIKELIAKCAEIKYTYQQVQIELMRKKEKPMLFDFQNGRLYKAK